MPKPTSTKNKTKKAQPEPNWIVLSFMNILIMAVFGSSIVYAVQNYHKLGSDTASPITNMMFPLMILWSCCLAYFFGFFGISFVDKQAMHDSPSSYGLQKLGDESSEEETEKKDNNSSSASTTTLTNNRSPFSATSNAAAQTFEQGAGFKKPSAAAAHPPRADGAICSDVNNPNCAPANSSSSAASHKEAKQHDAAAAAPAGEKGAKPTGSADDYDYTTMNNDEVLNHIIEGVLKDYQLEKKLGDYTRAVEVRRSVYEHVLSQESNRTGKTGLELIPYQHYDYGKVFGANCEIVIGYVPIPLGIVGPIIINQEPIYIPMATTEGCLVASCNRGCKAISVSGGCYSVVMKDAITRAPCLRLPSAMRAAALKRWVSLPENYELLETAFNSTTNYGKLLNIESTVAGRNVFLRFNCMSGDAMGMNMVSKGCLKAIEVLQQEFPDMILIAISGNMCTDKKPAAINWIMGRGKSIVVEATIPEAVVKSVLKSSVHDMIETNRQKNLIGSAMAGSVGGFNAHAANLVTAVYLATGQDPAQNVESSNCLTIMEYANEKQDALYVSVTMPSVEVGTVGGGTHLPAQAGCLDICGVRGAAKGPGTTPGDNSRKLAQIVGAAVLAGELSLMAALAANHLVNSHMQHNRKPQTETAPAPSGPGGMRKNVSMPTLSSAAATAASTNAKSNHGAAEVH